MQENDGKYIFGVVKVGDKGQIVIPRDARKIYDIKPGDALLLRRAWYCLRPKYSKTQSTR